MKFRTRPILQITDIFLHRLILSTDHWQIDCFCFGRSFLLITGLICGFVHVLSLKSGADLRSASDLKADPIILITTYGGRVHSLPGLAA